MCQDGGDRRLTEIDWDRNRGRTDRIRELGIVMANDEPPVGHAMELPFINDRQHFRCSHRIF